MIWFAQICYQKFDIFSLFLVSLTSLCQSCLAICKSCISKVYMAKYPVSLGCVLIQDVIEIKKSHPDVWNSNHLIFNQRCLVLDLLQAIMIPLEMKNSKQLITSPPKKSLAWQIMKYPKFQQTLLIGIVERFSFLTNQS